MPPAATINTAVSTAEYLRDDAVRTRMREYCGATADHGPTCAFVTGLDAGGPAFSTWDQSPRLPPGRLEAMWNRGADISRALWDADHLVMLFEVDYQNVDHPEEPFVHPERVFRALEPAYRSVVEVLRHWSLPTFAVMTGRGYQFTSQVPWTHPVVNRLVNLALEVPHWFGGVEARRPAGVRLPLSERQARAAAGLGLLHEYLAHVVLRRAAISSRLPVVVNGTIVGTGGHGRECASLDFSHAGDPLDVRHMRVAFSPYQWHRLRPDIFGDDVSAQVPPIAALPRTAQSLDALLSAGRGLAAGRRAARRTHVALPDAAGGLVRLIASYRRTSLAAFHRTFYADKASLAGRRPPSAPPDLPACMRASLARPNDLLLKPEHIQHVVRGLLARHWTAASIARLLRSRYEAPHEWGDRWQRLDPETRADFDVRVFAGLVATGVDGLLDFNCVSAQEKNLCPLGGCPHDLRRDRDRLLQVRST